MSAINYQLLRSRTRPRDLREAAFCIKLSPTRTEANKVANTIGMSEAPSVDSSPLGAQDCLIVATRSQICAGRVLASGADKQACTCSLHAKLLAGSNLPRNEFGGSVP
jgi:hypothetical protein